VVVNLDPYNPRETMVHLTPEQLGLPAETAEAGEEAPLAIAVHDEISGQDWTWGRDNYVRLDPAVEPAHVLHVRALRSPL
jgi:starch synthase (maltosyl-transferring)